MRFSELYWTLIKSYDKYSLKTKTIKESCREREWRKWAIEDATIFTDKAQLLSHGSCLDHVFVFFSHGYHPPLFLFTDSHGQKGFCEHTVVSNINEHFWETFLLTLCSEACQEASTSLLSFSLYFFVNKTQWL